MSKNIQLSNTGSLGPLFSTTCCHDGIQIVDLPIDTKGLKHVDILLSFNANIYVPASVDAHLVFIIKKYEAKSSPHLIGSTYVFTKSASDLTSQSFSFRYADCDVNPGKYRYSIQLSGLSLGSSTVGTVISNATLTLLAVGEEEKSSKGGSSSSSSNSSSNSSSSNSSDSNANSSADASNSSDSADSNSSANNEVSANEVSASNDDAKEKNEKSKDNDKKKKDDGKEKDNKDSKHQHQ